LSLFVKIRGNRFEMLKSKRKGQSSIRISCYLPIKITPFNYRIELRRVNSKNYQFRKDVLKSDIFKSRINQGVKLK